MKKLNQFDIFKTLQKGNEVSQEDKESMNSYLLLRWLQGNANTLPAANMINHYYEIPEEIQYNLFRKMLLNKKLFIQYPKSIKAQDDLNIKLIQKHYNVNLEKAQDMLELISQDELNELRDIYNSI